MAKVYSKKIHRRKQTNKQTTRETEGKLAEYKESGF